MKAMNVELTYVPKSWKPGNPWAIKKWMQKMNINQNPNTMNKKDEKPAEMNVVKDDPKPQTGPLKVKIDIDEKAIKAEINGSLVDVASAMATLFYKDRVFMETCKAAIMTVEKTLKLKSLTNKNLKRQNTCLN